MSFTKLCFLLIISSMLALIFSRKEKELTAIILAVIYVIVTIVTLVGIERLFKEFEPYIEAINVIDMSVFIKIGGISVAAAISSAICSISGQKEISDILDMAATIEIILLVFPLLTEMLRSILNIFGG